MKKFRLLIIALCAINLANASDLYLRGELTQWEALEEYKFTPQGNDVYVLEKFFVLSGEFKFADAFWQDLNYGYAGDTATIGTINILKNTNTNISTEGKTIYVTKITVDLQELTCTIEGGYGIISYTAAGQLPEVTNATHYGLHIDAFNTRIVGHEFADGYGQIIFDNVVTDIYAYAFYGCTSLDSITIPDSVKSIGNYAFGECAFTYITIPNSVDSIGDGAFNYCKKLTTITIPNSVTHMGNKVFCGCSSLSTATIGNGVKSIGDSAFYYCDKLTSITMPDSLTYIGDKAFYYCKKLNSITIPNSVTSIGDWAFHSCFSLSSITIPNSVDSIGDKVFHSCYHLSSITIPNSVTSIGSQAFNSCSSLTSITIPNSVTSIGDSAFWNCALTSISIPNSVTSIGKEAFRSCDSLASITIGTSVNSIGERAFDCFPTSITWNAKNCKAYHFGPQVKSFVFGDSVEVIPTEICKSMPKLTSITIPNSVVSIGNWAFLWCESITSVIIGNGVTSIGELAFYGCLSLPSVIIPNSVTSIGNKAFENCDSLASVTIGNSVTSIGDEAFGECTSLSKIFIPNSVTSIGDGAFCACSSLSSIDVDTANTHYISIDGVLFNYAKDTLIQYPVGNSRTSYTIPNSVTSIVGGAFYEGISLISVTIPNGVTSIGSGAFSDCDSLQSITIPNSVTSIGKNAFNGCSSLTSITCYATTPPACDDYCFHDIDKSIPLYVPAESINAYKAADEWEDFTNMQAISEPSNLHKVLPSEGKQRETIKAIKEGKVIILRDGKTYNAQGGEL